MQTVKQLLEQLGLTQYAEVFAENDVDLGALRLLTDAELDKIGVSLGHRKKLLKAITELNGDSSPAPAVPAIQAGPPARTSVGAEGERRQLTVLFCDMVGFTELANRVDPEVLQKIIRSYEDTCAACVTRYEGYVFQRLGDGIVAFFGYPLAHEGEAERAIHAGLQIIESFAGLDISEAGRLQVRIGIATGLVVVSSAEKGAVGETMNLASRLQGIAQPGNIVVSERVRRLAGGAFDYQDLGEQALKGIAHATHAYGILGMSEAASRFEAAHQSELTPLVGREQELGLLLERWVLAQDGEGQVELLSGEPGIGKSRILSALRERLEGQGAQALRFQCSPYYINSAFWPSIDNFERALKFGRDESPASRLDKLQALIVGHYQRPLTDVRCIASMLSIPCDDRYGALSMTPQKRKDETIRALVDLTEAAARKQPSVMLFEDAHWADPTTLEVLDLLVDRVKSIPLLIVFAHRPEFRSRWSEHGHVAALNLSKLTRAQSGAIVGKLAGGKALPGHLLEQILTKTDGVPLFVEELTKSILESGELKETADRYECVGTAHTVTIPATLRDSLMARLDRFMAVKEIAQIGAAIGREFSYELIAAVAPMSQPQLDSALAQLTDSGLAFRRGAPPEATYAFKHALVQDAAYDSLLKSRRQELHAKIAKMIEARFPQIKDAEPELLAHHFDAAGMLKQAVEYWHRAARRALDRSAVPEALAHASRGLEVLGALPESLGRTRQELGLQLALGQASALGKGWTSPEADQAFSRARTLCEAIGDTSEVFPALWGVWASLDVTGRMLEARDVAEDFLARARRLGDTAALVEGNRIVGEMALRLGDPMRACVHLEEGLRHYDPAAHRSNIALYGQDSGMTNLVYLGIARWLLGYPDQGLQKPRDGLALATQLAHPFSIAWAHYFEGLLQIQRRDWRLARRSADAFLAISVEHGFLFWQMQARLACGITDAFGGRDESIALVRQLIADHCAVGAEVHLTFSMAMLAGACHEMGQIDSGLSVAEEGLALVEKNEERFWEADLHRVKGELLMAQGATAAGESCQERAIEIARHQQARSLELRAATSLARLWQSEGKRKEAYDLLAPVYNWFTEGFDTKDLKEAKALLDELKS